MTIMAEADGNVCSGHELFFKYRCITCDQKVCENCWIEDHASHTVQLLAVERQHRIKELLEQNNVQSELQAKKSKLSLMTELNKAVVSLESFTTLCVTQLEKDVMVLDDISRNMETVKEACSNIALLDSPACKGFLQYYDMLSLKVSDNTSELLKNHFSFVHKTYSRVNSTKPKRPFDAQSVKTEDAELSQPEECNQSTQISKTSTKKTAKAKQNVDFNLLWEIENIKLIKKSTTISKKFSANTYGTWNMVLSKVKDAGKSDQFFVELAVELEPTNGAVSNDDLLRTDVIVEIALVNSVKLSLQTSLQRSRVWGLSGSNIVINFERFISFSNLFDPNQGWLKGDSAVVKCTIKRA